MIDVSFLIRSGGCSALCVDLVYYHTIPFLIASTNLLFHMISPDRHELPGCCTSSMYAVVSLVYVM